MPRSRRSAESAVSIRQRRLMVSCWPVRASSSPARMRLELSLICKRPPPSRDAIRRANLSGGMTAQARPASSTARGMPQTAQLASSCARTEPPAATMRAAPCDSVPAHAGKDDGCSRVRRKRRLPTGTSGRATACSPRKMALRSRWTIGPSGPSTTSKMRIARRDDHAVGKQRHPFFRNQRLALGCNAQLAGEHRHERRRQMLRDEDRHADALRERLEEAVQRMDAAGRRPDREQLDRLVRHGAKRRVQDPG